MRLRIDGLLAGFLLLTCAAHALPAPESLADDANPATPTTVRPSTKAPAAPRT
jgi:hypothetical protein